MPNFSSFLDSNVYYYGAKIALVNPATGEIYTYRDLRDKVNRVANGLRKLGVGKGDRVCVYTGNRCETLISYFAIWRIGAIAVPANPAFKADEMEYILNDSESNTLITLKRTYEEVISQIRSKTPALKNVVVIGDRVDGAVSWNDLISSEVPTLRPENCSFDDVCQIQYTSGTTGFPKGAMLTHGKLDSCC